MRLWEALFAAHTMQTPHIAVNTKWPDDGYRFDGYEDDLTHFERTRKSGPHWERCGEAWLTKEDFVDETWGIYPFEEVEE